MKRLVGEVPLNIEEKAPRAAASPRGPMVVFTQSRKESACDESTILLGLTHQSGVPIPSACCSVVGGTCKVRKTEGEVTADSADGLEPYEVEAGYVLTCVSWAKCRVVLNA